MLACNLVSNPIDQSHKLDNVEEYVVVDKEMY